MIIIRLLICALIGALYTQFTDAQAATTAGVPVSQNIGNGATSTMIPSGLGGSSTGVVVVFTPGATAAPPSSSVIVATTLTGAALSDQQASLSSQLAHNLGSDGMYTSTTGNAITGISTGLSGGYNDPQPASSSSAPSKSSDSSSSNSAHSSLITASASLLWASSVFALLLGVCFFF